MDKAMKKAPFLEEEKEDEQTAWQQFRSLWLSRVVLVIAFFASIALIIASLEQAHASKQASIRYLFTFGDSLSSTSFDIHGLAPTLSNRFGNPPYPGKTTVSGPNWIGYLVQTLTPPTVLSYNLAFGGSVVDGSLVPPPGTVYNFNNATDDFLHYFPPTKLPWNGDNSVFVAWWGINDILRSFKADFDLASHYEEVMEVYFFQLERMYQAGATTFLLLDIHGKLTSLGAICGGDTADEHEQT